VVVLRATQKLRKALPLSATGAETSEAALGDWYVNRIVVNRQPLLLLVSSKSRLPMLAPARNVKELPERLPEMIRDRISRLGLASSIVDAEVEASRLVLVGKTIDRSITGQMVDFAKAVPYYVPEAGWNDAALRMVEERLAETPCLASRPFDQVVFPDKAAARILTKAWPASSTRH
jgi:hypothetical protein